MAEKTTAGITGSARVGSATSGGKTKINLAAEDGLINGTIYMPAGAAPPKPGAILTFEVKGS